MALWWDGVVVGWCCGWDSVVGGVVGGKVSNNFVDGIDVVR
jgi:hypothetical protein